MYRDDEHLGDGYDQYLLVVLIHRGGLTCSQRDRITTAGRGSIVTLLPRESYWSNAEDGTQATMLYVPVDILEGRGVAIEPMAAAIWEAGAVATGIRVLADITLELEDDRRDRRALHFEQALIEMLLGLFSRYVVGRGGKESPAQKVRRQVVDAIADNYWNSSYDVSAIVADVGVSRRSVYKSFEGHEASVGSLLRAKRLDAAEALMRSADVEASLDQIGKAVGFVSGESFARTYKQSRGIAATEYRDRYLGTDPVNAI